MKRFIVIGIVLTTFSCGKINREKLSDYLDSKPVSEEWLIACAAGDLNGWQEVGGGVTAVFFYPVEGATNKRYFETKNLKQNKDDFSNYREVKNIEYHDVFNGYLNNHIIKSKKEKWGIMTYEVNDSIRVSDPIKIQPVSRETERRSILVTVEENGITPSFSWEDGEYKENVIYFQVVSDKDGNLISGTYTLDREWTFYDTSNVVINIKPYPTPFIETGKLYDFTLMSVSEDNWVNVAEMRTFKTF
ncbi:MAG: hypothetical protein MK078_07610 [Crocinitomicaceae bacterium]|nr:hypothetical protein [Crocinitomicaceae bacterium]